MGGGEYNLDLTMYLCEKKIKSIDYENQTSVISTPYVAWRLQ